MTIAREDPGLLVAICDHCGERRLLDPGPDAGESMIDEAVRSLGWSRLRPVKVKYPGDLSSSTEVYPQDFCGDCMSPHPGPRPLFGSGRRCRQAVAPLANDPVDEWPRAKVWESVGLRSSCGHPPGPPMCPYCERGHSAGDLRPGWRR